MGRAFSKFKSYHIQESRENRGYWEIYLSSHEDADYIFPSVLDKIDDFLEVNQLQTTWELLLYLTDRFDMLECNESKEQAEQRFAHLNSPYKCLEYIKTNNVIKLLEEQKPDEYTDMIQQIRVLMGYWEQGYYIYSWD